MTTTRRAPFAVALAVAISTASLALAQGPGGRGAGGPGGGFGGPGGFGGRGGSMTGLLQNPAVQTELKLSEKQIEKIKQINELATKKRTDLQKLNPFPGGPGGNNGPGGNGGNAAVGGNGGNGGNGNGNANGGNGGGRGNRGNRGGGNGGNAGAGAGGVAGGNNGGDGGVVGNNAGNGGRGRGNNGGGAAGGNGGNGGGGGNGGNGGGAGGNGGPGGRFANMTEEQRTAMQEFFTTMRTLQTDVDAALLKVLDKKQQTRLSQVHLQSMGVNAFRNPQVIERFNINEGQVASIREIMNGTNQAQREARAPMRDVMAKFIGNDGNNNGRPTREQMQELQNNPEYVAARDKVQKVVDAKTKSLDDLTLAKIVNTVLDRAQSKAYKAGLGTPFDVSKLNTGRGPGGFGGFGGPGGPPGGNTPPATAPTATKAAPPDAANPAAPARKSLRDRRGGGTPN